MGIIKPVVHHCVTKPHTLLLISLLAFLASCVSPPKVVDYTALRKQKILERRNHEVVLVHRGAWAAAFENTLEAYAAAMDLGADGCEIDIRQTADGVLVLFHDDFLSAKTTGYGDVSELTLAELMGVEIRNLYGLTTENTKPAKLESLLQLAKETGMLLHLDIKVPDVEGEVA